MESSHVPQVTDDHAATQDDADTLGERAAKEEVGDASSANSDDEDHLQGTGPALGQVEPLPGSQKAEVVDIPQRSEGRSHEQAGE